MIFLPRLDGANSHRIHGTEQSQVYDARCWERFVDASPADRMVRLLDEQRTRGRPGRELIDLHHVFLIALGALAEVR